MCRRSTNQSSFILGSMSKKNAIIAQLRKKTEVWSKKWPMIQQNRYKIHEDLRYLAVLISRIGDFSEYQGEPTVASPIFYLHPTQHHL